MIQVEIGELEKDLSTEMEESNPLVEFDDLEPWITGPRNTHECQHLYDRRVSLLLVMKGVHGWIILEKEEKHNGDEIPGQCWKDHYANSQIMDKKLDAISFQLGVPFLYRELGGSILKGPNMQQGWS